MHQAHKEGVGRDGCSPAILAVFSFMMIAIKAHTAAVSSNSSMLNQASVFEQAHLIISFCLHVQERTYGPSPSGPTHQPQNPTLNQPCGLIVAALAATCPPLLATSVPSPPPLPRLLPVANNLAYISPGRPSRITLTSFRHQSEEQVDAASKQNEANKGTM